MSVEPELRASFTAGSDGDGEAHFSRTYQGMDLDNSESNYGFEEDEQDKLADLPVHEPLHRRIRVGDPASAPARRLSEVLLPRCRKRPSQQRNSHQGNRCSRFPSQ